MSESSASPPLMAGMALIPGWQATPPTSTLEKDFADQVLMLSLNQWDQHAYFNFYVDRNPSGGLQWTVRGPSFTEAYEGELNGLHVLVANSSCFVSPTAVADAANGRTYSTGVIAVDIPAPMPYVRVVRPLRSLFGGHGWRSGDKTFDKRYDVQTLHKKDTSATTMLVPVVPLIAARDDWVFSLFGHKVVCVARDPFASVPDAQRALDQVVRIGTTLDPPVQTGAPGAVADHQGMPFAGGLPLMPDGSPFDPDKIEQQLSAMTPEQQAAYIVKMTGQGGPTEQQIADAIRRDQSGN